MAALLGAKGVPGRGEEEAEVQVRRRQEAEGGGQAGLLKAFATPTNFTGLCCCPLPWAAGPLGVGAGLNPLRARCAHGRCWSQLAAG